MFLSFPWPLVPDPSEKRSISIVNVCCALITAPLVRDEAEKLNVKLSFFLHPFLCLTCTLYIHSSHLSFSCPRLTLQPDWHLVCVCVCTCVTLLKAKAAVLCGARKSLCVLVSFEKQPILYTGNKLPLMLYSRFVFIFSVSCQVLMFLQRRRTWCLTTLHFHYIALTMLAWEPRVNE